jgi:hypothetical protein
MVNRRNVLGVAAALLVSGLLAPPLSRQEGKTTLSADDLTT